MSFDPFEARLQFLQLLRKLNASQASIQKVVAYAVKYGARCGEDLWECIMEECAKGTLNSRINVLYFLDSLAETSTALGPPDAPYLSFMRRDLGAVVERVVPPSREGVLNLKATRQILESWRTRRILEPGVVEAALAALDKWNTRSGESSSPNAKRTHAEAFSKQEIIRRMEEDRERHKRLRERIWILPIPPLAPPARAPQLPSQPLGSISQSSPSTVSPFTPASPASRGKMMPPPLPPPTAPSPHPSASVSVSPSGTTRGQSALEVEFDQAWEAVAEASRADLDRYRMEAKSAGIQL